MHCIDKGRSLEEQGTGAFVVEGFSLDRSQA
jgi:hypothetical protein